MNTATKVVVALVVIVAIAGGAYYLLNGSPSMMVPETSGSAMNNDALPAATGSVDDFAAAMQADLSASAAAIKAFDTGVDASASKVKATVDTTTSYDPNSI
jgi:hypothetical protein